MEATAFLIIGGGTVGAGYVRQLLRAEQAGRLRAPRLVVVDRDPHCAAARFGAQVQLEVADWAAWLDENLDAFAPEDHFVPYHWAPHLLEEWLTAQLRRRGAHVARVQALAPRALPYDAPTRDGGRALSYASWICPPTCIEPALCPHTRGPKDWSLADDLSRPAPGESVDGHIVFRCLHLLYGVGTIPVRDLHEARDRLVAGLAAGPRRYRIATSSHCHALAGAVEVTPAPQAAAVR